MKHRQQQAQESIVKEIGKGETSLQQREGYNPNTTNAGGLPKKR